MNDREWLSSLKEGDQVILHEYCYGVHRDYVRTVQRLTVKLIVLDNGLRFVRKDGREYGSTIGAHYRLVRATNEALAKVADAVRLEDLRDCVKYVEWNALPLETLEKIVGLLPENQ